MKALYRFFVMVLLVMALVSIPFTNLAQPVAAASAPCIDSTSPLGYTVHVCITAPADGATLHGTGVPGGDTISSTAAITSNTGTTTPFIFNMIFYLNGNYVATDFQPPFTFTLPTNHFADGAYVLTAQAEMKDGFITSLANISVNLNTGSSGAPPVVNSFMPTSGTNPTTGNPFVVAATGDGAGGEPNATAVTNLISNMHPNLFLYLGDVYDQGTDTEFLNWYAPDAFFGRFKSITNPVVGSHEYLSGTNYGYEYYWNGVPDYYSFNSHGWHFIALNSNTSKVNASPGNPEYTWLQADLAANTSPCTLVYYHHPYFTIGQESGRPTLSYIWQLLAQKQVTIVLAGNDHDYERWMPLDGNLKPSAIGITQFVIGTGGHAMLNFLKTDNRVAFGVDDTTNPLPYGALELQLNSNNAVFNYRTIAAGASIDSGTIPCKGNATLHSMFLPLISR